MNETRSELLDRLRAEQRRVQQLREGCDPDIAAELDQLESEIATAIAQAEEPSSSKN